MAFSSLNIGNSCCHIGPRRSASRKKQLRFFSASGLIKSSQLNQSGITSCRALMINVPNSHRFRDDDEFNVDTPTQFERTQKQEKQKPLVRVRLSVNYRVHRRQMLCIGGNQFPFGWSFLSIAKIPMTWNNGDIWTCEIELPAAQRVEYKYVILEEQDWTKLENEDSQGLVEITYRTAADPGKTPDVHVIQKQMAIVAWQPGPNRVLQVPSEDELQQLERRDDVLERLPARSVRPLPYTATGRLPPPIYPDPFEGTWEVLRFDPQGQPFLDRHDVWGWASGSSIRGNGPSSNPSSPNSSCPPSSSSTVSSLTFGTSASNGTVTPSSSPMLTSHPLSNISSSPLNSNSSNGGPSQSSNGFATPSLPSSAPQTPSSPNSSSLVSSLIFPSPVCVNASPLRMSMLPPLHNSFDNNGSNGVSHNPK